MRSSITLALIFALLVPVAVLASRDPLPAELLQAKTVYVQMGPFVPTKKNDDQGARASYLDPCNDALQKWGRLKIVDDPKQADIIVRISSEPSRSNQRVDNAHVRGSVAVSDVITTIDVIQRSSEKRLWSGNGLWVWAFSAKAITKNIVNGLRKDVEAEEKAGVKQTSQ